MSEEGLAANKRELSKHDQYKASDLLVRMAAICLSKASFDAFQQIDQRTENKIRLVYRLINLVE